MKLKKLQLGTHRLDEEKVFYSVTIGFPLTNDTADGFTVRIGWSELEFIRSKEPTPYHYCFLIPAHKLEEGLKWMDERVEIISIENNRKIQHFESWNADSFYFYDASGNIAECIVRYDLNHPTYRAFGIDDFLGVNEIGLPTESIVETNRYLEQHIGSSFWKGDLQQFGAHGSQEGLILLPNYKTKKEWFPSDVKITPSPFEAFIENNNTGYVLSFRENILNVKMKDS